ncbi:putative transcriptional regulatory protein YJL206C [Aspergillus lentulus]|nr:putative transcriptional regulatory protein YJL206C [Aspergillus lentulus]
MSFGPGGTDYGSAGQEAGGEGSLDSQWNGVDEHEVVVKERVAVCEHFLNRVTGELDADMLHSVIVAVSGRCDPSIYLQQKLFPCEV